jgi:hypothetical protein
MRFLCVESEDPKRVDDTLVPCSSVGSSQVSTRGTRAAEVVVYMASLSLDTNVQFLTIMATRIGLLA